MLTWEQLEYITKNCTKCPLSERRTHVVVDRGSRTANIMFIGEGPGEQEDIQGKPFVGPAGQLLDKILAAAGFSEENAYIANIVKCRPYRQFMFDTYIYYRIVSMNPTNLFLGLNFVTYNIMRIQETNSHIILV